MNNKPVFDVVRALLKKHNPEWDTFTSEEIKALDDAIKQVVVVVPAVPKKSKFFFSTKSLDMLKGVHPHLQAVMLKAIGDSDLDFTVLEGKRTLARQKTLLAQGATKTLNSRHLTGHAVDVAPLVNGKVSWDWPLYYRLEKAIKAAAKILKVPIEWGGDWRTFKDGPHWQLPFKEYPK